jgi:DNA-binding NarL/FixJ family response regulator
MREAHILVISREASLREGMVTLLASVPKVGDIAQARSRIEALRSVEVNKPDLVILDLAEGMLDLLEEIQGSCQGVKSLLLVEGMRQQTQAQVAGADVALIKGYPAHELIETVQALLSRKN